AVCCGEGEMVLLLLKAGASVRAIDAFGNSPLHIASMFGQKQAAEWLVKFGAEVDGTAETRSWTPLMLAINEHYTELAEWLLMQGADPNHVDAEQGWTPLLVACDQGLTDLSLRLIDQGVKVDVRVREGDVRGRSALHLVSYFGAVDLVKALIQHGVDVNELPDGGGLSALHWAVYNHHIELLRFLLEHGGNANLRAAGIYQQRSPLHYAVSEKRMDMARLLLDYDADPLLKDTENLSPLDMALSRFQAHHEPFWKDMVKLLES
ncbi:MAG: ankyrin repeat domain-containing protein, partial [Bacteroidota bacterium]